VRYTTYSPNPPPASATFHPNLRVRVNVARHCHWRETALPPDNHSSEQVHPIWPSYRSLLQPFTIDLAPFPGRRSGRHRSCRWIDQHIEHINAIGFLGSAWVERQQSAEPRPNDVQVEEAALHGGCIAREILTELALALSMPPGLVYLYALDVRRRALSKLVPQNHRPKAFETQGPQVSCRLGDPLTGRVSLFCYPPTLRWQVSVEC
jgi:hypothetical protein